RQKALFAELRRFGIVPPGGSSMETLERLLRDAKDRLHVDAGNPSLVDVYRDVSETGKTGTGTGNETGVGSARARASPLPPDWKPTELDVGYARSLGLSESQIARSAEKFRNHQLGKGAKNADWSAVWRNWCLADAEHHGCAPTTSGPGPLPVDPVAE